MNTEICTRQVWLPPVVTLCTVHSTVDIWPLDVGIIKLYIIMTRSTFLRPGLVINMNS